MAHFVDVKYAYINADRVNFVQQDKKILDIVFGENKAISYGYETEKECKQMLERLVGKNFSSNKCFKLSDDESFADFAQRVSPHLVGETAGTIEKVLIEMSKRAFMRGIKFQDKTE